MIEASSLDSSIPLLHNALSHDAKISSNKQRSNTNETRFALPVFAPIMRSNVRPSSFTVILMTTFALILTFKMFGNRQLLTIPSVANKSFLSSIEIEYLSSFNDLLLLRQASYNGNEIIFASYDIAAPTSMGRLKIFRIENSSHNGYIKFYSADYEVRAINGLLTKKSILGGLPINVPLDVDEFEHKWRNGRFIKCIGLDLSNKLLEPVIDKTFVKKMVEFRDFIEHYDATPFLFGGTLLGWYRECAFIRDTTDVDFAMKFNELDETMLKDMEYARAFKLYWIIGKINDSLEVSVYANSIKIDLFVVYRDEKNDWVGGMIVPKKEKLKWIYPAINDLCVGDLHGELFNVPCNVEKILEADYGINWKIPQKTSTFIWHSSHKNVQRIGYWEQHEWSSVYKIFR